jgi:hypothetical protein
LWPHLLDSVILKSMKIPLNKKMLMINIIALILDNWILI